MVKLIIIFILCFTFVAQPALAQHTGPLWAVWTHSEDPQECMIKTTFWIAVVTAGLIITFRQVDKKWGDKLQNKVKVTEDGLVIYWND